MTQIVTIQPGEKGIDVAYHYPTGASIRAKGYTFAVVYDSPNVKKNATDAVVQDYIDCGLGVWHVYEVNAAHTMLGRNAGIADAQAFNKTLARRQQPLEVAGIFANDTDTTAANVAPHLAYMLGAQSAFTWPMGGYLDIDLASASSARIPWSLLWLPNAWAWDHPNPRLKSAAIQQARDLGYHMIQGRISDDVSEPSYDSIDRIAVDINHCIRPCVAWGNPRKEPTVTPYVFQLADGELGIRHESGSRSINDGELRGPYKGETVYPVPAGSNWEAWIKQELAKYVADLQPGASPGPAPGPLTLKGQFSGVIAQ